MVYLLLAPYNDSVQLGQGFNSFLQKPCLDGAVDIPASSLTTQAARSGGAGHVSQVVSYSSRFVEKISDVVRGMNISAASSIKSGTIEVSGNSLSVDEAKFASSDMNAVISVRVINQTSTSIKNPEFKPLSVEMDSKKFFETYGDCYVSGFMEGGDLHGIVSVKVLDASKKSQVESALKGQMNGSSAGEFTLSEGSGSSGLEAALRETETTVTVSWSGGGQIKADEEEWTLDSLVRAASAFPSRVASCPQRTWAILTRYDNNRSFVEWASPLGIKVPNFAPVQQFTSDLLDNYMEYKNNLARLQAVMASPLSFKLSPYRNRINLGVEALVAERRLIKEEMKKISDVIDGLNIDPSVTPAVEIKSPEVWATRLPVPKDDGTGPTAVSTGDSAAILSGFSFANGPISNELPKAAAPEALSASVEAAVEQTKQAAADRAAELQKPTPLAPAPPADICTPGITELLNEQEQAFVRDEANKREYAAFRFDSATGHDGGGPFNDAVELQQALVPVTWPRTINFLMVSWGGQNILRLVQVMYEQIELRHGSDGPVAAGMTVPLAADEQVNRLRMAKGREIWGVEGVAFVEVFTSAGNRYTLGDEGGREVKDYYPYDGCTGLKGFWGSSGDVLDKLAPIWGH